MKRAANEGLESPLVDRDDVEKNNKDAEAQPPAKRARVAAPAPTSAAAAAAAAGSAPSRSMDEWKVDMLKSHPTDWQPTQVTSPSLSSNVWSHFCHALSIVRQK
jgi:hypothetical protein